jgi:YVTN family beta-propeller protein
MKEKKNRHPLLFHPSAFRLHPCFWSRFISLLRSSLMRLRNRFGLLVCLLLSFQCAALNAQTTSGYHVTKTIKLGGEGGWDYLTFDAKGNRLFISRGTHVMVVDADSGVVVGDIPDTQGVHGIALAQEFDKGYTSNGRASTVTVFDLKTLKVLKQIPVGKNPDTIIYDAASKRIFTMNGASKDSTAIDAKTDTVASTVALDGRPEFATADEKGHVYVNLEDKSMVAEIDSQKLSVVNRWPLAPCEEPSGMAIDRKHGRLFSGCSNKMMAVVDADSGKVITTEPIGAGVDANGFDPETGFAFSSNGGDGTLTIVHEDSPDKFSVVDNVPTQRGARTMALDTKRHRVFLVTAEFGQAPAPTPEQPRPRRPIVPGSFTLLVVSK